MIRLKLQMAQNFLPSQHCSLRTNTEAVARVDVIGRLVCSMYEPWEGRTGLWTDVARSHLTKQTLSLTSSGRVILQGC